MQRCSNARVFTEGVSLLGGLGAIQPWCAHDYPSDLINTCTPSLIRCNGNDRSPRRC